MRRATWVCAAIMCWSLGCSASVEQSDANTSPVEWSASGLRYVPLRENHPEQYSLARAEALVSHRDQTNSRQDMATLSDRELTARMTGLTVIRDWIYRVEPEPQTVEAARHRVGSTIRAKAPTNETSASVDALAQPLIMGSDDRRRETNTTSYPYSTIVQLSQTGLPEGYHNGATGVMIGPSTMLSAAHVFYDGANFRTFDLSPGADESNPAPFGTFGCYGVVIASSTTWPIDDYAVVDFKSPWYDCNDSPGLSSGWMAAHVHSDAEVQSADLQLYGYPIDFDPWPQLWGMNGRVVPPVGSDVLYWTMDQTEGQSGAPVYRIDENGYPDVVAITSRGDSDFGQIENDGARITDSTVANIMSWSSDY